MFTWKAGDHSSSDSSGAGLGDFNFAICNVLRRESSQDVFACISSEEEGVYPLAAVGHNFGLGLQRGV